MDKIVKEVAERAEVSEEVAQRTVELVVEVLKEKLPAPIAEQIDGVLSGESDIGDIANGIGDLLGG